MANKMGFLPYSIVIYDTCLLDAGYGKSSGVPLNILSNVLPDYFTKNTLIGRVVYSLCTKIILLDHFFTDCDDCLIHGNHGYLEYPGVCEKYIQVYPDANGNKASTIRKCFGGLFWDNSAMVCRRPQEVNCAYGKQQIEEHMRFCY